MAHGLLVVHSLRPAAYHVHEDKAVAFVNPDAT